MRMEKLPDLPKYLTLASYSSAEDCEAKKLDLASSSSALILSIMGSLAPSIGGQLQMKKARGKPCLSKNSMESEEFLGGCAAQTELLQNSRKSSSVIDGQISQD